MRPASPPTFPPVITSRMSGPIRRTYSVRRAAPDSRAVAQHAAHQQSDLRRIEAGELAADDSLVLVEVGHAAKRLVTGGTMRAMLLDIAGAHEWLLMPDADTAP